ncbi:MAG TPA: DUF4157 domain-containing protein [Dehalococcoidia bacterium]
MPMRPISSALPDAANVQPHVRGVLSTAGEPLDRATRAFMEPRFGHDFSRIRIHADWQAQQSARRLNAQAYAAGHHIAFAPSRYAPGSHEGRWLLAHELAHVVQQAGHGAGAVQRKGDVSRHDWTVITEITVEAGATGDGRAQGVDAFGQAIPIDVEVNQLALDIGRYTIHQKEMDPDWDLATRVYQGESKGSAHLVYVLPEHVKVAGIYTLVIAPRSRTLTQVWSEIKALPKSIQTFVIGKYGRAATLDDYERALRIGKQLQDAGLTSDEIYQLGKMTSGKYTEKSIAASLAARADRQSARAANLAKRGKAESALFGREELYKRYLALLGHFKNMKRLAALAGTSADAIGVSPGLIKERDQLEADLVASGFPGGIADFAKFINDYEQSFQSEALAYAMDMLLKYEHILHQEYDLYAGGQTGKMSAAAKALSGLSKIREPAQELYGKAAHARSLRKDLDRDIRDMSEGKAFGARAESASLGREAAIHESSADKLVRDALPDDSIVSWQDFPREKLVSKKTVEDVRYEIAWYISVHEAAVQRARQLLTEKPSRIYTLDKLLSAALEAQDVEKGSIYDLIIQHRVAEIESEKKVKEILLAVLTVALTVVTFGGGTPALLASAAIVGVGGAQAASAIEDLDTQTTFYVSQLLSQKPTAAWAVVAVVGLALDAGSLVSALKTVVPAAETFNKTGDLVELGKDLAQVDPLVSESVLKAAEQARAAERQFKASVDQFKGVFTGAGGQAKAVVPSLTVMAAQKGGEIAARLLAMTYYYIKTRLVKSFPKFVRQLEQDGLIVWAELAPAQQRVIRQAFDKALELKGLPYGKQLYTRLSERARQTYPEATVDRFVAQGKAIGKTDDEIVAALEADLQSQERAIAASSSTEQTRPGGLRTEESLAGSEPHAVGESAARPRTPDDEFAEFEKWLGEEAGATGPLTSDKLVQLYRHGSRATVAKYLRRHLMKQAAKENVLELGEFTMKIKPGVPVEKQVDAFVKHLEGAHSMPQSFGNKLPKGVKYDADDALVILTDKPIHTAMDQPWKDAFNAIRKSGVKQATAQQVFDAVADGIRRTPGMAESEKAARIARLHDEMFVELGLVPGQRYDVPRIFTWQEILGFIKKRK